ncbi:MAG: hypothetical protein Q4C55_08535 [Eubacterium sp.]|nr:hypothetical protein [Eubacterium sp.]
MKPYKASVTPTPEDIFLLNKQFSRWGIGPYPVLKTLSYFALIYATYALFMIYLQLQLFAQGLFVYLGLFAFRLITGLLAALFFFGKLNPIILKFRLRLMPQKHLAPQAFVFREKHFELTILEQSRRYTYGEILRCNHANGFLTFQTRQGQFIIHEADMTQGSWPEFQSFMRGKKDDFNIDPKLWRKKALRDLGSGDEA